MQRYKDYRPTAHDNHYYINDDDCDREDWFVTRFIQTRDSGCYEQSNFAAAVAMLGGVQDELVEVHRFGHWGPGWFEIILVHPSLENRVREIEEKFENYPVLDEDDLSERECNAIDEAWECMSLREKIQFAKENGCSIFAARRSVWDCNNSAGDAAYKLIEKKRFVHAQLCGLTEIRRRAANYAKVEHEYRVAVENAENKKAAALWVLNNFPNLYQNWIYYNHTGKSCFGWRKPLSGDEYVRLSSIIHGTFPGKFEIKVKL